MPLSPTQPQRETLRSTCQIIYPQLDYFHSDTDGITLFHQWDGNEEIIATFPDWHTLIDHLRRELATWHATTQSELWQIIEPEVRAQIAEIVGIESDGY